jgi:hypothetical protein
MAIFVKARLGQNHRNCVRKGAQLSITTKQTQSSIIATRYLPFQLTIIKECSKTLLLISPPPSSLVVRCRKHQTFNDGAGRMLEISKEESGAREE